MTELLFSAQWLAHQLLPFLSQSVVAYTDDLLCYTFLATELIAFSHKPGDYSFFAGVQFPLSIGY